MEYSSRPVDGLLSSFARAGVVPCCSLWGWTQAVGWGKVGAGWQPLRREGQHMRDGFKIIDCDRHVMEPADMWERYLDRPFRHYVGWLVQATDTIGARINDATWRGAFSYAISCGFDSKSYLDDMDREGIDVAFLFSTAGLGFCWYDDLDPECSAALCRAYNNWLYDYCSIAPDRLFGMMLLPLQDVELAQKELCRAATELGLRGVFWRPNPHFGRLISDPAYA